jgi:hypothetical protein
MFLHNIYKLCRVQPFGLFSGVWCLIADVSEHCVCSIFIGAWMRIHDIQNTAKAWNQEYLNFIQNFNFFRPVSKVATIMSVIHRMTLRIVTLSGSTTCRACFHSYLGRLYPQPSLPAPPEWAAATSRYCRPVSRMYSLVQTAKFMVHSRWGLSYYLEGQMHS